MPFTQMGLGLFTEAWATYESPHPWRKLTFSSTSAIIYGWHTSWTGVLYAPPIFCRFHNTVTMKHNSWWDKHMWWGDRKVTKGKIISPQGASCISYLWACGVPSWSSRTRCFPWANRTLRAFPTTAMRAQAFPIFFPYLDNEMLTFVRALLISAKK